MPRTLRTITLALVATLALGACGSGGSNSGDFNKADVRFTRSMIPHHEQAVEMARLADMHASTPAVKELAKQIESAQGPEIKTMKGWLRDWGKSESAGSMSDMDHGSSMPGMMSGSEMSGLGRATGAAFDTMFLTMMVAHHTGAIEMAKTEQSQGRSAKAKALAQKIEAAQTTEIAQMRKLLTS